MFAADIHYLPNFREADMKNRSIYTVIAIVLLAIAVNGQKAAEIDNPAIDMKGFLKLADKAAKHRKTRRLTEDEFIAMSKEPGVLILDARSKEKFDELHISGAVNLSFPDITIDSLAELIPDKETKILIYCNNNFENSLAFPTKVAPASLNLSTYVSLYTYGYKNVYELGPLLDANTTKIELISSEGAAKPNPDI